MEKAKLFGDVYDIVMCYFLIVVGVGLFGYSFVNEKVGFLYGGSALIVVFGGLLFFSYYARYRNRFTEFKTDFKSIAISVFVVLLIVATLFGVYALVG